MGRRPAPHARPDLRYVSSERNTGEERAGSKVGHPQWRRWLSGAVLAGMLWAPASAWAQATSPVPPMAIWGSVVGPDGSAVTAGTVQAYLNGQANGVTATIQANGTFGGLGAGAPPDVLVEGTAADAGEPVTLAVGKLPAAATVVGCLDAGTGSPVASTPSTLAWQSNWVCQVRLTVGSALGITTASLPGGTVGVAYSAQLQAAGGTPPYTWSVPSGSLPAGLTLDASTGAVSGTPSVSGLAFFTARATDSSSPPQTADQALAIVVAPSSGAAVTSTASGTTGASLGQTSVAATGTGQVAVSQYSGDPEPSGPGTQTVVGYFDVAVAPGSSYTSLTLTQCDLPAASGVFDWWTGSTWDEVLPVTPPGYVSAADVNNPGRYCLSAQLGTTGSTPAIGQLSGTPFAVGLAGTPGSGGAGGAAPATVPVVTGVSPSGGPGAGGTTVTVTGSGFTGATAVAFGTNAAQSFQVDSDGQITAVSPPGSGTVDVRVTTPGGTSAQTPSDEFTYAPVPTGLSVGAGGGTLATADGAFSLTVPSGALGPGQTLTLSESCSAPAGLPRGLAAASCVFTLSGGSLSQAAAATIRYDASVLNGLPADRLSVYGESADGTWTFRPTAVQAAAGAVEVGVSGPATLVVLANLQRFPDVPPSFWASSDIDALLAANVVQGFPDGSFLPDATLTRAQFVKMLSLALGLTPAGGGTRFTDVPANAWYAPFVSAAVQAGLVQGTSPTAFSPDAAVTREQMAVLLARALRLKGAATLRFSDATAIDGWAAAGVEAAVSAGYLNGFPDGSFRPLDPTTRAQAAKVLALAIQHIAP
jgi:hypothetical protein